MGSHDVAKKNVILCIWCNAMCLCGLRLKKTHYFPLFHCSEKRVYSDWPAIQCVVIGQIPQACNRNKNDKTHYKQGIFASSGDIINDYNDLYCLFTRHIASRSINLTICICDRRNDKQALLYTAQNLHLNSQ